MSSIPSQSPVSVDDYLDGENRSDIKHEYLAGRVYAMAGATNAHNLIASNALGILYSQLAGNECRVFNFDTKLRVRRQQGTRRVYEGIPV